MTLRRLCLLVTSLSFSALAHANTLQPGEITRPMPTDFRLWALSATLLALTALGVFLSFRFPLFAGRKPVATRD